MQEIVVNGSFPQEPNDRRPLLSGGDRVGSQAANWTDEPVRVAGGGWMTRASDRAQWRRLGEDYFQ